MIQSRCLSMTHTKGKIGYMQGECHAVMKVEIEVTHTQVEEHQDFFANHRTLRKHPQADFFVEPSRKTTLISEAWHPEMGDQESLTHKSLDS